MAGQKVLTNNAGTITEVAANQASAGAGDAGKLVALGSAGLLDLTMMPTGIGPDTATMTASEAISAGAVVNVWNSSGAKVRNADATVSGKEAHGFVLSAIANGGSGLVYFPGTIDTAVTGLTVGVQYLSTTAGTTQSTAPTGSGNVVQRVGVATSATALVFEPSLPIVLA